MASSAQGVSQDAGMRIYCSSSRFRTSMPTERNTSSSPFMAFALVVWTAVCLVGCDPGRSYVIPGAREVRADGVGYVAGADEGVEARFYASLFTISGSVEIRIVNKSPVPIEFQPTPALLLGADAVRIPVRCQLPAERKVILEQGQTLTIRCGFDAKWRGGSYVPALDTLTVLQPGLSRAGQELVVLASMRGS